jgi:hypothetical protein
MIVKWTLIYLVMLSTGKPAATTIETFSSEQECAMGMKITVEKLESIRDKEANPAMIVCMPGRVRDDEAA